MVTVCYQKSSFLGELILHCATLWNIGSLGWFCRWTPFFKEETEMTTNKIGIFSKKEFKIDIQKNYCIRKLVVMQGQPQEWWGPMLSIPVGPQTHHRGGKVHLQYCIQSVTPRMSWQWHDDVTVNCFWEARFSPFGGRMGWGAPNAKPLLLYSHRDPSCGSDQPIRCVSAGSSKVSGPMWLHVVVS